MLKQEIIDKAIYIQFPKNTIGYNYTYTEKNIHKLPLPTEDEMYKGWKNNTNHFTTEYHRKYVLPLLSNLFTFNYNENDFILKENIIDNKHDISMLYPKQNYIYEIYGYSRDEHFDNLKYEDLLVNTSTKSEITPYHKLYKYGHECSRLINKTILNNRKLFISGDSQMIPDIPILSCYFKEIFYFDNRYKKQLQNTYKDVLFTDILIELNNNNISFYLNQNFN